MHSSNRSLPNIRGCLSVLEQENPLILMKTLSVWSLDTVTSPPQLAHLLLYHKQATTLLLGCYHTRDAINWMELGPAFEICRGDILGSNTLFKVLPYPLLKVHDGPMTLQGGFNRWGAETRRNEEMYSRLHGL